MVRRWNHQVSYVFRAIDAYNGIDMEIFIATYDFSGTVELRIYSNLAYNEAGLRFTYPDVFTI